MKQELMEGVRKGIKSGSRFLNKNSAKIFFWLGTAGMCLTVVSAIHDTPKAVRIYDQLKKEQDEVKPVEVVKQTWKCFIPTASTMAISLGCLIFSNRKYATEGASLAAAYALSESTFAEYRRKVFDKFGKKKANDVRDEIVEDHIKATPLVNNEIIMTGTGDTLCYDCNSGRYFTSNIEKLKKVENVLNKRLLSEEFISLNDYYYEVGLDDVDLGYDRGWSRDRLGEEGVLLHFIPILKNDKPCVGVKFDVEPWYGYDR